MNVALGPRQGGCCVVCDAPCYRVKSFDPKTRRPRQMGEPIEGAKLALFLQVNGARAELTLCAACAEAASQWTQHINLIWKRVILAFQFMRDNPPVTHSADSKARWHESHNRAICDLVANPPIALIGMKDLQTGGIVL
mgnify:CR=1 FL=1